MVSKDVEEYLSKSQEAIQTGGVGSLPMGAHVRDDEQVWLWLFLLVVLKSYSLYSLMSVSLNLKNLTWQRQLKAYISDWNRNQNVAKSTYLHWLLKIHILWEGQTIWKNLPYVVAINKY